MFYYGKCVSTDYKEALQHFKEVAKYYVMDYSFPFVYDQNDSDRSKSDRVYCVMDSDSLCSEAFYYLALVYKDGLGVSQDNEEALRCAKRAFEFGCKRTHHEIGDFIMT
jgi:TPR repeat protein